MTTPTGTRPLHSTLDQQITKRTKCQISEEAFEISKDYRNQLEWRPGEILADEEEELLQMAIRQSLLEQQNPTPSSEKGSGSSNQEVSNNNFCYN